MAKDDKMIYLAVGIGALVIFMTDNPIKDAIMKLVPAGAGTPAGGDDTTTSGDDTTTQSGKHKRGHRRGKHSHSNVAYMDCGN